LLSHWVLSTTGRREVAIARVGAAGVLGVEPHAYQVADRLVDRREGLQGLAERALQCHGRGEPNRQMRFARSIAALAATFSLCAGCSAGSTGRSPTPQAPTPTPMPTLTPTPVTYTSTRLGYSIGITSARTVNQRPGV